MNKRVALLGVFGTIIEWMDYTLYGYLASTIATQFFPKAHLKQGLIWVFILFASGFLVRPIGALLFGHYADRFGRKRAMILTIFISGITTLLMGCLPGYQTWGIFATFSLLIVRLIQSLAIAGENGVVVFMLEHTKKRANFYGSLVGAASSIGMFISAFLVMIFTSTHMPAWSWRLPYIIGGALCLLVSLLRYSIDETPEFTKIAASNNIQKLPFLSAIKKHPIAIFTTISFAAFMGLYTYVCNVYFHSYLINEASFTPHTAALATTVGQIIAVCALPLSGILADRVGKNKVFMCGLVFVAIVPPVMFMLANTHQLNAVFFAMALYGIGMGLSLAPMFKTIFDLFPAQVRYSGYTGAWNISVALFGGTAPLVSQWLTNNHVADLAGFYVSISALIALAISVRIGLSDFLRRRSYRVSI